jgi:hypothetical protein
MEVVPVHQERDMTCELEGLLLSADAAVYRALLVLRNTFIAVSVSCQDK